MNWLSSLFGKKRKDMVEVPPGHEVVVVYPAPVASFGYMASGVWIADLGPAVEAADMVDKVSQLAASGQPVDLFWILQPGLFASAAAFDALGNTLRAIVQRSGATINHVAVLPYGSSLQHASRLRQLVDYGMNVFESAEDGACFIEVHRPDGIVIGMPGTRFHG